MLVACRLAGLSALETYYAMKGPALCCLRARGNPPSVEGQGGNLARRWSNRALMMGVQFARDRNSTAAEWRRN
jgi:hypothetical protein